MKLTRGKRKTHSTMPKNEHVAKRIRKVVDPPIVLLVPPPEELKNYIGTTFGDHHSEIVFVIQKPLTKTD